MDDFPHGVSVGQDLADLRRRSLRGLCAAGLGMSWLWWVGAATLVTGGVVFARPLIAATLLGAVCALCLLRVPVPAASRTAFFLVGASTVILESELTGDVLAKTIVEIVEDSGRLNSMQVAAKNASFPGATDAIVHSLFELIEER